MAENEALKKLDGQKEKGKGTEEKQTESSAKEGNVTQGNRQVTVAESTSGSLSTSVTGLRV